MLNQLAAGLGTHHLSLLSFESMLNKLAAGLGNHRFAVDRIGSLNAATTISFFNVAQERDSSELIMERYQAMLAGVVTFSFYGLW